MSPSDLEQFWQSIESRRMRMSLQEAVVEELSCGESTNVTPDLLYAIAEKFGSRFEGSHLSPRNLSDFVAHLAAKQSPKSILDPTCGSGLLLHTVATQFAGPIVHGVEINEITSRVANRLLGHTAKVFLGNTFDPSLDLLPHYDLIVAEPPFNLRMNEPVKLDGYPEAFRHHVHEVLACWVGQKLSEGGMALLMMPGNFAWSRRAARCKAALNTSGTAITAYIHVPGGSLQGTHADAYVVVLERGAQTEVFVAQYTQDADHQDKVIANLLASKQGGHAAQGRIVDHKTFRGYPVIEAREKLQRVIRRTKFSPVPMQELVVKARRFHPDQDIKDLPEFANSVFLPRYGRGSAVTHRDQITSSINRYFELAIDPDLADARYVARMFSQQLGQYLLNTIRNGSTVQAFTLDDLMAVDFYLPTPESQHKVLGAQDRLVALRSEINELEAALWADTSSVDTVVHQVQTINQEDRFEDWLEMLPFPLASILWRHRTATGSVREKYEILLHFFEAVAEFLATIHLSAFSSDAEVWVEHGGVLREVMGRQGLGFGRATFGLWKCVIEVLGSRCRKMLEKTPDVCSNLYCTQNHEILAMLCHPTVIQCLQEANSIRNTWHGHVGAVGERQAQTVHAELDDMVQRCRGVFGRSWSQYELVKPIECRFHRGIFRYRVRRITGTRTPFATADRECVEGLEDESLYLFDPDGNRGLQLLPFVRVMQSPRNEANACYFYSRQEARGQSRFVSYHFEEEADYTGEFPEILQAIDKLGFEISDGAHR